MFKKITALFLLTAFTHVYAVTPIQQSKTMADELNRTFDELNYKLNVEWDQKDGSFFDRSVDEFEKEISALQSAGLTSKELVQHALGKIKDKDVFNDINEISNVIDENQMGPEEARAFTISKLGNTYSHGASWSGSRHGNGTAILMGAIIVILVCCYKHRRDQAQAKNPNTDHQGDYCDAMMFPLSSDFLSQNRCRI